MLRLTGPLEADFVNWWLVKHFHRYFLLVVKRPGILIVPLSQFGGYSEVVIDVNADFERAIKALVAGGFAV